MREIFKQLAYGRSQTAFSEGGLPIGAGSGHSKKEAEQAAAKAALETLEET